MYLLIDEYRNLLALLAVELLLTVPYMKKRNRYALRLASGIAVSLAAVFLYLPVYKLIIAAPSVAVTFIAVSWYLFLVVLTGGVIIFCHKTAVTELIWILITAYAVQHIVYVFSVEFVFFGLLDRARDVWGQFALSVPVAAVVYTAIYFLFIPNIRRSKHLFVHNNWRNCLMLALFFLIFFASTFVNQANARRDGINYLSIVSDFVNCLFVIVVQYVSLRTARMRTEKEALVLLLENEKKQYETFRNAVEYINIKCHDLKYEIASSGKDGNLDADRLDEITDKIAVYESFVETGNGTLDALLTDKNFICKNNGISFSCIADASGFNGVKNEDLYCLFGNILDNAIEYVSSLEEKEKKFIRLYIKSKENLKIIHQENYFSGRLSFASGLPQTTKSDKINHGFGTKSIKRITEKYGGAMSISAEDNLFKIDIVLTK